MENISFVVSKQEIISLANRLPSMIQPAGLLIVAFRNGNVPSAVTGFRVFFIGWDTTGQPGTVRLVIARSSYAPSEQTSDMQLVADLRSGERERDSYLHITSFDNNVSGTDTSASGIEMLDFRFDLAFLDWESCNYMLTSNNFYYNRTGQDGFYQSNSASTPINDTDRGIKFSSAVTTFKHGVIGLQNRDGRITDSASFSTLIARPSPEPVIVDTNHSGAVAYDIMPTCPPYWKPGAQFVDSVPFLSKSAEAARAASIKEASGMVNSKTCLGGVILILIAIVSLLYWLFKVK